MEAQRGTLVVSLNAPMQIGVEQTRADVGDGNQSDGGGFEDLTLVLVDASNKVVAKNEFLFDGTTWSSVDGVVTEYNENKSITVTFSDLDVAAYTVYAYANVSNSMTCFGDIQALLNAVAEGTEFGLAEATFPSLGDAASTATPTVNGTNPMLLTAREDVNIEIGTTDAVVELLRPLVEFNFKVVNHCANYPLQVKTLSFKNFNPQTAYISPHDVMCVEHATNNVYRSLPAFPAAVEIAKNSEQIVYQTYLYENTSSSDRYQFNVELALVGAKLETTTIEYDGGVENVTDAIVAGNTYALKNSGTNVYLIDNNGSLETTSTLTNDNFLNAEFEFSNSNNGYIESVKNRNRYYCSLNSSSSGNNWTFNNRGNGVYRIQYTTYSYYGNTTYYLRTNNGGALQLTDSNDNRNWQLCKIRTKAVTVSEDIDPLVANNQQISYIQSNGSAVPLREMHRNQKITVTLNVYFEETSGTFRFYVEEWDTNHNNGTTFN